MPFTEFRCDCYFGLMKPKTHHIVDALSDEFALTALGVFPILVGSIND